jgi:hypothetical protein
MYYVSVLSTETDLQCTQNPEFTYTYIRRSNSNYSSGLDSYHTSTEIVHRRRERVDRVASVHLLEHQVWRGRPIPTWEASMPMRETSILSNETGAPPNLSKSLAIAPKSTVQ